jgi:hypothetical protein
MARPSKGLSEAQLVVRMPGDIRDRIERLRGELERRAGGATLQTSAVVRLVLERGLDALERGLDFGANRSPRATRPPRRASRRT